MGQHSALTLIATLSMLERESPGTSHSAWEMAGLSRAHACVCPNHMERLGIQQGIDAWPCPLYVWALWGPVQ